MISYEEAKALRETDAFDPRNVRDEFKNRPNEEIREELDNHRSEMVLCLSNEIRDMNLSSCIRSANSFNINHVVMTGRKSYDRRGTVGAHHYIDVRHEPELSSAMFWYKVDGYHLVALEYDDRYDMSSVAEYKWHPKTLMIVGEEGRSISSEILDLVDDIVYIPMMGTVRSLNLASAVSIALYDYTEKMI